MKRIISLMFLLFSITLFSQTKKVSFENELVYKVQNRETLWFISNKYPELILVKNISLSKDFLYYYGNVSSCSLDENNEVVYYRVEFKDDGRVSEVEEITKSKKKEIVNGYKCDKFIVRTSYLTYEVFITDKTKINNIDYLNALIDNKDKSIFKSGLIVRVSIFSDREQKFKPFIELENIKKSDKSIFVDFEKLDLRLNNETDNSDAMEEVEVIEEVFSDKGNHIIEMREKEIIIDENHIYHFGVVQIQPEYPEGISAFNEFIKSNLQKPKDFPEGSKRKVFVSFVIEKDGSLSNIKIIRDVGYGMGEEVIRVLKLSKKWKQGFMNDKPVRVEYLYPVTID